MVTLTGIPMAITMTTNTAILTVITMTVPKANRVHLTSSALVFQEGLSLVMMQSLCF